MSIKHWPEGERPREKLLAHGAAALSDAELLAILLRTGIQGMSAVDLARYLLQQFGSLAQLMSADAASLCRHKGMGMASYTQFAVVREIGRRVLAADMAIAALQHGLAVVTDAASRRRLRGVARGQAFENNRGVRFWGRMLAHVCKIFFFSYFAKGFAVIARRHCPVRLFGL